MNSIGVKGESSVHSAASGRASTGRGGRAAGARLDRQAVAERAIADLVVVLVEDDEALRRHVVRARAEPLVPEARVAPVVHVRAAIGLGQLRHLAELRVVAL